MRGKKILCLVCVLVLCVAPLRVSAMEATTEEFYVENAEADVEILTPQEARRLYFEMFPDGGLQPRSDLGTCEIGISKSDGKLLVVYSTSCRGVAEKIGVRNMTLQQKDGLKWKDLVIRSEYSENTDAYFGGFSVGNPEVGGKYRVKGTHYVVKNSVETSRYAETEIYTMPKN